MGGCEHVCILSRAAASCQVRRGIGSKERLVSSTLTSLSTKVLMLVPFQTGLAFRNGHNHMPWRSLKGENEMRNEDREDRAHGE